tara:strand:+ start:371 stop:769 length:399 start_codon:yes stop_codon:yes gene_type:complete
MEKKYLKKIIARSPNDLQVISACCSESKVKVSDIKFLPLNKIFLLSLSRKDNEEKSNKNLINSIIKFEYIESSKSKNINQNKYDELIELITIDVYKIDQKYKITLYFNKLRFITLIAEVIEVTLEDQKMLND